MKNRLKGLLALVLSLTMLLSMVVVASAQTMASSITVNGVTLNSSNPYWKNDGTTASANDYNAYFDATTGTLTLNNATIGDTGIRCDQSQHGNYIIVLAAGTTNSVTTTSDRASAIVSASGSVTIQGSGTLNATGGANGIWAKYTVAISESATVNVTGTSSCGITTTTFHDGVKINTTGAVTITGSTYGIGNGGSADAPIINSANVTVKGGTAAFQMAPTLGTGITATASASIDGSTPEAYDSANLNTYKWFKSAASTPTIYPVKIGGVGFASNNLVIDSNDIAGVTGTATYVPADGTNPATLTLNDFILENYHYSAIYATENLTINLIGATNKVTSSSDGGYSGGMAIYVDGNLKITGDNNASLTAGGGGQSAGIVSTGNTDLTAGAVTVNGTLGSACIITMNGKINISGGTVTVKGNSDRNAGIHAGGDITISGGMVKAEGTNSSGIYSANGTVSITGGTVNATGVNNGIYGGNTITIGGANNPTVNVGCETGLAASTVNIAGGSTVTIEASSTTPGATLKAINCSTLNMSGDYQWSTDNSTFTDSATLALDEDKAAGTAKLYIKPVTSSGGPGTVAPTPPPIYYPPTVTPTTPTETIKTESANTFDGGIALSVAMTILTATGSVVLAKKRED